MLCATLRTSPARWQHSRAGFPISLRLHSLHRHRCPQHARLQPAARSVRRAVTAAAAVLGAATDPSSYDALVRWCIEQHQLPPLAVEPAVLDGEAGTKRSGFVASKAVTQSDVVLEIPGSLAITSVDVSKDPQLEALARGRSELVGLALWLMLERSKASRRHEPWLDTSLDPPLLQGSSNDLQGGGSEWHALLQTLPQATLSPILWSDEEREQLLRGSPVQEVRACGITPRELRYFLEKCLRSAGT